MYTLVLISILTSFGFCESFAQTAPPTQKLPKVLVSEGTFYFGAGLEVGVPDGLGISAVLQPLPWLRFAAGPNIDFSSVGIHGSLSFAPVTFQVSPALAALLTTNGDVGHQFEGELNWFFSEILDDPELEHKFIKNVTYDYVNGQLGVELKSKRLTIYLHGGVSYVHVQVHDFQQALQENAKNSSLTGKDPDATYIGPSGKLGIILHF